MILDKYDYESLKAYLRELSEHIREKEIDSDIIFILVNENCDEVLVASNMEAADRRSLLAAITKQDVEKDPRFNEIKNKLDKLLASL